MLCSILHSIYGKGTRAAQVLNYIVSVWWGVAVTSTAKNIISFDLPTALTESLSGAIAINALIVVFTTAGIFSEGRAKQVLKTFGLILGALWQAILANMYVSQYPPLSMMMGVSVVLSIWFLGAVLFICRCEGVKDGVVVGH